MVCIIQGRNTTKLSFKLFIQHLLKTPLNTFDDHWIPQYYHCQPNLIPFNAVLKVESLAKDLKKHFGKLVKMKLEKKLNSDSLVTTYFKDIEPGDINKLYNVYQDDFNSFQYDIQVTINLINENNEYAIVLQSND